MLCTLLFVSSTVFAQVKVTGVVTDAADGSPIPFASIIIKGTAIGVSANADGSYVFDNVPATAILIFSSIGYQQTEVSVDGRRVVNATLSQEAVGLDEIMVVAYGSVKKGSYSGSATQINQQSFKDVPVVSFEQAIVGAVPGVQISQRS